MGFLFQDAALFDSLTLYENLALPLKRLTDKTQEEIDSIVDKVLGQVGLGNDKQKSVLHPLRRDANARSGSAPRA